MTAYNRAMKYELPDDPDPSGSVCYLVPVPNDVGYINAFFGALNSLGNWANWERDTAHTAKDVAYKWREIIHALAQEPCSMTAIQFRQPNDCSLEYSLDGGDTWLFAANFYNCASGAIDDALDSGTIAAPGQQPPGGEVPAQECHTYNIELRGNSRWHCPVPVAAKYRVTVSNANGGWYDGALLGNWTCPSGGSYALGSCATDYQAAHQDDPAQSVYHNRLVGNIGSTWFDMFNTTYTVPDGTPDSELFLQANDNPLSDNDGSIRLTVTVCNYSEFRKRYLPNDGWMELAGWGVLVGNDYVGPVWRSDVTRFRLHSQRCRKLARPLQKSWSIIHAPMDGTAMFLTLCGHILHTLIRCLTGRTSAILWTI